MVMTKQEARQHVMDNYHIVTQGCDRGLYGRDQDSDVFEEALDVLLKQPSIAQNIREAAIYFPKVFLGDVECEILDTFIDSPKMLHNDWRPYRLFKHEAKYKFYEAWSLMYMLFVAEALE